MISIAMAVYNGEKFIDKQINSILKQTYRDIELIIVDDNSTDRTQDIIINYAKNDTRIKYFRNQFNLGCARNFEKAISLCVGDFIALCDQDDIWDIHKLQTLLDEIDDNILIYSDCALIDENDFEISSSFRYGNRIYGIDSYSEKNITLYALFNSFVLGCSIMFSKVLLQSLLPIRYDSRNHDKWIVFVASIEGRIKFIPDKLFYYRVHGNNYSMLSSNVFNSENGARCSLYSKFLSKLKISNLFYLPDFYIDKRFLKEYSFEVVAYNEVFIDFDRKSKIKKILSLVRYVNYLFANQKSVIKRVRLIAKYFLYVCLD